MRVLHLKGMVDPAMARAEERHAKAIAARLTKILGSGG